jgi:hypothetical protein
MESGYKGQLQGLAGTFVGGFKMSVRGHWAEAHMLEGDISQEKRMAWTQGLWCSQGL